MNLPRTTAAATAFTLLELLVAVSIFAVVLGAITTVFYSALRLRNKTAARFDEILPVQHALTIIQRDLAGLVAPGGTLGGNFQTPTTTATVGSQNAFTFATATASIDDVQPWSEVQKISYYLDGNPTSTGGRDLFRGVTRNLLPSIDSLPDGQWLLGNVKNLTWSFYDGSAWKDSWDSTTQTNLPKVVKLQIDLVGSDISSPTPPALEVVVPVIVTARTNVPAANANAGGAL
jgi:type II secretion system protein J